MGLVTILERAVKGTVKIQSSGEDGSSRGRENAKLMRKKTTFWRGHFSWNKIQFPLCNDEKVFGDDQEITTNKRDCIEEDWSRCSLQNLLPSIFRYGIIFLNLSFSLGLKYVNQNLANLSKIIAGYWKTLTDVSALGFSFRVFIQFSFLAVDNTHPGRQYFVIIGINFKQIKFASVL